MNEQTEVKIQNLTTGYYQRRRKQILLHNDINLSLKTGQLICILGPNGVGKSTLIKTLLGFELPMTGEIYFNNRRLDNYSVKELAQIVSVVLTEKIDDIYLTAREIISTGRYPYGSYSGKLRQDDLKMIQAAEQLVGIEDYSRKIFAKLSDGEKQKVMIARAIAQDTPFIFLDEPVAYLDAPSRISIMQLLKKLVVEMRKGVLMATHDMDSALNYADSIWLLGKRGEWDAGHPDKLILSGKINHFFDTKNVSFDAKEKRFGWTEK